jgi:DNA helicase HerA-like ATPase
MWIVTGTKGDLITLVSSKDEDGILPLGSYLTVEDEQGIKHILLVEQSQQRSLFEPSPLIVDVGLPILEQDQECKNIIQAREIRQFPLRSDGKFGFTRPNNVARRTTQEEIDEIFTTKEGFPVFLATHYLTQNAVLRDDANHLISVRIPCSSLYLQTMVCGQTGSGKTVAMKHIIEQFLMHEGGAVLAINVKSIDLLTMDQDTLINTAKLKEATHEEWAAIHLGKKEMGPYSIYIPSSGQTEKEGVNPEPIRLITLRTRDLEPSSLLGVLQNVTDRAAEALPNIFRYWKENESPVTFRNFINWFRARASREQRYIFPIMTQTGDESEIPLHASTCGAILRSLESAAEFFDSQEGECVAIREDHIMVSQKLSVIDLSSKDTVIFGAVLLRHLLSRIYNAKAVEGYYADLPVLIVIDEVHQFYRSSASKEALEELNAIARMGRSEQIGVIFASQNPGDLPRGLMSIVNNRIFFRSLENVGRQYGMQDASISLSSLANGYALMMNVDLPHARFVKFPIPIRGVKS